jgi:phosphoadenosine phosphosulfate reductase
MNEETTMHMNSADIAAAQSTPDAATRERFDTWLTTQPLTRILRWAVDTFGTGLVMTSSFGLNGVALIHALSRITRNVPIVFVDTGCLFRETLETKRKIEVAYGLNVLTQYPELSIDEQAREHGPDLYARQPDLCCTLRKIEPMRRAMAHLQPTAILNGRARFQAQTRRDLRIIEWDTAPARINPFTFWSQQQIKAYVTANGIPYNPLHDMGYASIGCHPCTRPITPGDDIRAGRWVDSEKLECGLWASTVYAGM